MEQDSGYHAGVLRGVIAYARTGKRWAFQVHSSTYADLPGLLDDLRPSGVVVNVIHPEWAKLLRDRKVPAVNIGNHQAVDLPRVGVDEHLAGQMVARHLLERGFRHFGYYGRATLPFSTQRQAGFLKELTRHGTTCSVLDGNGGKGGDHEARRRAWLVGLPKPAGIFACSDFYGMTLAESCRQAAVHVPEEVAIVSMDNNDLMCELTHPPLSSVINPGRQIGFEAARLLDRLMQSKRMPRLPVLLAPPGIVTRQSSDIVAVDDAELAEAIRFIRNNAHRSIDVAEVLNTVHVCRRSLERRFRQTLGRTPLEEIRRVHVERAKELLAQTDLATPDVADRSGFMNAPNLAMIFKKVTGLTPTAYRRQYRVVE